MLSKPSQSGARAEPISPSAEQPHCQLIQGWRLYPPVTGNRDWKSPRNPPLSPQHFPIQSPMLLLLLPVPCLRTGAPLRHLPAPLPSAFVLMEGTIRRLQRAGERRRGVHSLWPQPPCPLWLQLGSTCGLASLGKAKPCLFTPSGPGVVRASCNGLYACFLNATHTSVGGPLTAPL